MATQKKTKSAAKPKAATKKAVKAIAKKAAPAKKAVSALAKKAAPAKKAVKALAEKAAKKAAPAQKAVKAATKKATNAVKKAVAKTGPKNGTATPKGAAQKSASRKATGLKAPIRKAVAPAKALNKENAGGLRGAAEKVVKALAQKALEKGTELVNKAAKVIAAPPARKGKAKSATRPAGGSQQRQQAGTQQPRRQETEPRQQAGRNQPQQSGRSTASIPRKSPAPPREQAQQRDEPQEGRQDQSIRVDTDRPDDIGGDTHQGDDLESGPGTDIDVETGRISKPQRLHGPDMHLIPGQGRHNDVGFKGALTEKEQAFQHQEEIAYHREQERMKNIADKSKKVFTTPRQS